MRVLTLSFCVLVGTSGALSQPSSIPADLFYAVADVRDASSVTVGQAPDRMQPLFPDDAEVLGTFGRVRGGGLATDDVAPDRPTHTVAVAQVDTAPVDVARSYALDPPSGWRVHNPMPPPEGGFASDAPLSFGVLLCPVASGPDDEPVRVAVAPRPNGGAYVMLSEGGWTRVRCDGTVDEQPRLFDDFGAVEVTLDALPVLSPPARGRQQTRGGGGSNDYKRQEATLVWEGDALAALRHYGTQFGAAGWATLASGGESGSAAGTWSRPSEQGPLTVTITVVETELGQFALRLTLASHGS